MAGVSPPQTRVQRSTTQANSNTCNSKKREGFRKLSGDRDDQMVRITTWNVGSMTGRSGEIVKALDRRRVDVCCVQETRWKGNGTKMIGERGSRYKFFWQGATDGLGGVGVLVAEKWKDKVVEVRRVNKHVILVKMIMGGRLMNVVSAYAPQSGRSDVEKDEFWDKLLATVSGIPERETVVVAGDLNGHVGAKSDGYEGVHGGFGFGSRNTEGERILEFCDALGMFVGNTVFTKKEKRMVTYESGGVRSMLDYILVRRSDRSMVRNIKVIPGEECVSQHHLVVGDFLIRGQEKGKRKKTYVPRLRVWKLQDEKVRSRFKERLRARVDVVDERLGVNEKWEAMKSAWVKTTEEICGYAKGPPRHRETWWWNDEVGKAIEEKKRCFKVWYKSKDEKDREVYREAKRLARKAVAVAQESKRREFVSELDKEEGKSNIFRVAKQMAKERQDVVGVNCLRDSAGNIVSGSDRIKNVWKQYMEKLLNVENAWDNDVVSEKVEGPSCRITEAEVDKAIRRMKRGKAAGPTGVVSEMLKASEGVGVQWLSDLCNRIIDEGKIPDDWEKSIIIPVYKGKGDPLECGSYRAVKLLEHAMKVVERVLEQRIRNQVKINEMQFGFMPGKGTTDAIFLVRQLQERYHGKGKKLHYAFVDLEKAFDRVPREIVWWALRKSGVDEWIVRSVMAMYGNAQTVVRTACGDSESFDVRVGLHQGSVLSPLLFIIVMDVIAKEIREGLPWELLYADDLVLIAESESKLKERVQKWKANMESKGLRVNVGKTKVMVGGEGTQMVEEMGRWPCGVCRKGVGRNSIQCTNCQKWVHKRCSQVKGKLQMASLTFICGRCTGRVADCGGSEEGLDIGSGISLEKVEKFCYLGDMLSANGGADSAVVARVRSAWKKFKELSPILTSKGASLQLKGRIYQSCVRSCMMYGSETWAMKNEHVEKLERTEMSMIRWMCGVKLSDRKTSADLRASVGVEAISDVLRRNRLRWFGHVERKACDDWVKKCTLMKVEGKRPRGRPKKTWMEVVRNDMKRMGLASTDAQDREKWRKGIWGKPANPGKPGK